MTQYTFDFDAQIPDLPSAFDLDAVGQLIEEKLVGPGRPLPPGSKVTVNRWQDIKYSPSKRCVTTYLIDVTRPGEPGRQAAGWQAAGWQAAGRQAAGQTIAVVEFTPDGPLPRMYQDDPRLPWLAQATDMLEMQRRFTDLFNGGAGSPLRPPDPESAGRSVKMTMPFAGEVQMLEIEPVRYKPGLHCVIRYRVRSSAGERLYYGKLFAEGGDEVIKHITALHEVSSENPEMPSIPSPVAYWPDMQLILQPAVASGIEFTKFAYDMTYEPAMREDWMRKAGATLGVLHQSTVPGPLRTIQDDLKDLQEYTAIIARVKPQLAEKFEAVIKQIVGKINGRLETPVVASHGAMRTDQFLLQNDRLAIIDLDGYCWANPARDLGNFLAYLCWKAIRQPEQGQFVEKAGRFFLEGYLDVQPDIDEDWLSIYQAASLLKIAGRRFRSLTFLEWPLVIHLIDAAEASLKEEVGNLEVGSIGEHRGTLVAHLSTSTSKTKFPATFIDKEFPALWGALNVEMMNDEMASILAPRACPDGPPTIRRAKLLAYKPGKRAVIRYDLEGVECRGLLPVYGKLYPEPYLSERAYSVMRVLWGEVFKEQPGLGVPEPLGIIPQLSMLVFIPAEGKFLSDIITRYRMDSPEVVRAMELAGSWLAQLHTHCVPLEKQFRVDNEVDAIEEWAEIISRKYREEARAAYTIAGYLTEQVTQIEFDLTTPIHKDFHYEHILVDGGLKVFDFDEMRLGDPNFDLAHFCANFYLLAYRNHKHTAQFSRLQDIFLNAYAQKTGWKLDQKFLFFYAYSCLKIAKQLCKLRGPRPWPEGEEQMAQVWLMLEQGLTMMSYAEAKTGHHETKLPLFEFSQIRRAGWLKANRIRKSATSSAAIHVSHRPLF